MKLSKPSISLNVYFDTSKIEQRFLKLVGGVIWVLEVSKCIFLIHTVSSDLIQVQTDIYTSQ